MRNRVKAFGYAMNGVMLSWRKTFHFRVHIVIATANVLLGFILSITPWQWCIIIICIGGVVALEGVNTSIEVLCDRVHPEQHQSIKAVKDIAAGAVLLFAIATLACGLVIFAPYFY